MPVCYQQFYGHEAPDDRLAEDDRVILKAGDEEQDEDDLAQKDKALEEKDKTIEEQDKTIEEKERTIKEQSIALDEKDALVKKLMEEIAELKQQK